MQFKTLLYLFTLVSLVSADGFQIFHNDPFAFNACTALLTKGATFYNATLNKAGYCNVKTQQALGSMTHCLTQMPSSKGKAAFLASCAKWNLTSEQYDAAYENATKYIVSTKEIANFSAKKTIYVPIKLSQTVINGAYDSQQGRYYNYNYATWFGTALIAYWYAVLFAAGVCNLTYFLFPSLVKSLTGAPVNWFRKYITLPALFGKSHAHHKNAWKIFQFIFPTRLEGLLVFIWFALAVIFNAILYHHDSPNNIWPKEPAEIGRKIADRTGIIAIFLIPTMILFAGRNNFMQWFSGWPQSRFIFIHKWMSRTTFILVVVHGVGMTFNGRYLGKFVSRNSQDYMKWGYVATVAMGLMVFQSALIFRRMNYEIFLGIHIILAVFFIAGSWIHTADDHYEEFIIAAAAIWVFDRVVRIARLVLFGARDAQVELIANETLRVTVARPSWWKPFPSCVAYIHFLRPTCFWQSHPFTIVDSVVEDNTITFYLKVKGGVTHGLYKYLSNQPDNKAIIKVSVEGPYGQPSALYKFENSVFIAGGNGIPGMFYEANSIIQKQPNTNVKFIWVIRHYRSIEWFYRELIKFKNTSITPVVYITQPHVGLVEPIFDYMNSSEEEEEQQEKKSDLPHESNDYIHHLRKKLGFVEFREGRPDIYELVKQEITDASGPIGFATCAHASMVDEARKSIADNFDKSKYRVELFEQLQSW